MFFLRRWPAHSSSRASRVLFAKCMEYAVRVSGKQMMLLQCQANPPPELANRRILHGWQRLEYYREDDLRAFYRIHAKNLRIAHKYLAEFLA